MKTVTIIALIAITSAWLSTGHFLTALIAQIELQRDEPKLYKKLIKILDVLSPFTSEKDYKFVESAVFPDDIKSQNWKAFNSWHFRDNYYFKDMAPKTLPDEQQSLVWAVKEALQNLNTNKPSKISNLLGKSFSLRYIIHLIGDMHQPLHNVSLVSAQFPSGDMGGNSFKVNVSKDDNLHAYWDSCLKEYKQIHSPISGEDFNYLKQVAKDITSTHTRETLAARLEEKDLEKWSAEGLDLAKTVVYDSIEPEGTPSEEYIKRGVEVVKQQLALGGYRLADTLKSLQLEESRYVLSQE